MKELDCRGLACPQPVLKTKEALAGLEPGDLTVIVDNPAGRDNVRRFAESQGCEVKAAKDGSDYVLTVTKSGPAADSALNAASMTCRPRAAAQPKLVVKISSRFMGSGPDELGRVLIKAFLKSLSEAGCEPETIVFYNSGVHLTCEGSEHLDALRTLEDKGVQIISCGTCLDFLGIKDKLAMGLISNMFEIIETLTGADRVVSP